MHNPALTTVKGVARTAFITEYAMLRRPLGALDRRVLVPLCGADSTVRRTYASGLARLDTLAAPADASPTTDPPPAVDEMPLAGDPPGGDEPASAQGPSASGIQDEIEARTAELLQRQENELFVGELAGEAVRRAQAQVEAKQEVEDELGAFDEFERNSGSGVR